MKSLNKSLHYIRRSPYQAMAAIMSMTLTSLVTGMVVLILYGSSLMLSYFEAKPQLVVYFMDDVKQESVSALENKVMATGKVAKTTFVSKNDALSFYKEWYKNDPLLLEMVTADILPSSLEISAFNASDLESLSQMVKSEAGIESVDYQADVVKTLLSWTSVIRKTGAGIIIFLSIESLLIMITVISMKLAIRKEEIEILQLIGASRWHISKPFLWEGVVYGGAGGIVGGVTAVVAMVGLISLMRPLLVGIPFNPWQPLFVALFFGGMLVVSILLGVVGSFFALIRLLR